MSDSSLHMRACAHMPKHTCAPTHANMHTYIYAHHTQEKKKPKSMGSKRTKKSPI